MYKTYDKTITKAEIDTIMQPKLAKLYKSIEPVSTTTLPDAIEFKILKVLCVNPFMDYTTLFKVMTRETKIDSKKLKSKIEILCDKQLIQFKQCVNSSNHRPSNYFPLESKAYDLLNYPKARRVEARFFKHSFYIEKVSEHIESQGYKALTEYTPANHPYPAERIDVAFYDKDNCLIAFEITLSTDSLISNIKKCVSMNAKNIIIVVELPKYIPSIQTTVENTILSSQILSRISYEPVATFIPKKTKKRKEVKNVLRR